MKIDNINPFQTNKTDSKSTNGLNKGSLLINNAPSEDTQVSSGDTVRISERSRLISKATELATLAPDIRSEKVADLTARIAAGTYNVSSKDVAESIIRKSISGII
ncbi:MAG: flagellar biosynthesis anti-sigma factor FlgM [Deltaproteobacteria bacterium]|jgi:negative regulator of flagellin synthesis FlgM|nr:flagellar biosynthesis anti-sigma factor FlgM [Deltaproteobacteria bacterium]